jgi:hypothetical protein
MRAQACSISGRTTCQSRPPLPHPSAGMAIEVIPRSATTRTRSSSPALMSSSRELAFQCCLVGKLMTYRRGPLIAVSKTNIRPGRISPRPQAAR